MKFILGAHLKDQRLTKHLYLKQPSHYVDIILVITLHRSHFDDKKETFKFPA